MKNKITLIVFCLVSFVAQAQEYATFRADTTRFRSRKWRTMEQITQVKWTINGKEMYYGCPDVRIPVDQKMDTIIIHPYRRPHPDTLICNIQDPKTYYFVHNDCCGYFDISDENLHRIPFDVTFQLKSPSKAKFLGTIDGMTGTGAELTVKPKTLVPLCRSAMKPNIFVLSILQIKANQGKKGYEVCLQNKKGVDAGQFYFKKIATKKRFMYLPLRKKLHIIYDPLTDDIELGF